jgi:hypothetical protein
LVNLKGLLIPPESVLHHPIPQSLHRFFFLIKLKAYFAGSQELHHPSPRNHIPCTGHLPFPISNKIRRKEKKGRLKVEQGWEK